MSLFSEIEKAVERGFRRWTEKVFGQAESDDLLLVHRAILEQVESRIEPVQRGRRLFPYNRLAVRLSTPDEHRRAIYAAAFSQDARLQKEIGGFLAAAGCEVPAGFEVEVEILDEPRPGLEIRYETRAAAARKPAVTQEARLVVVTGKTAEPTYALARPRLNIGRIAVLLDRDHLPVRRNDIVFEDDEVNATVSRSHAHLVYDAASGEYRVCDDGSQYGTRVFRDGRAIDVPSGNKRGERLRPGDEIYFGRACVRFEVDLRPD